jgi:predicted nucleic acid-binding Zn finger protein
MNDRLNFLAKMTDSPEIRHMIDKAQLVRAEVESFCIRVWTRDNRTWEVRRSSTNNEVYCTCPAYRFNKSTPKNCKHVMAICSIMNAEDIPVYIPKRKRVQDIV